MRIVTPAERATVNFEDLAQGTVFTSPDDKFPGPFLRTQEWDGNNAVDLDTGNVFCFQNYESVIPWDNAYLTLE